MEDVRTVRLKEFAEVVDCLPKAIELLEIGILCKIIAFNLTFEPEAIYQERLRLEGTEKTLSFDPLGIKPELDNRLHNLY